MGGSKYVSGLALDVDELGDKKLVVGIGQLGFFAALDVLLGPEGVLVIEMEYEFGNPGQNQSAKNAVVRNRTVGHNFGPFRAGEAAAVRFLSFGVISVHRYVVRGFAAET